jgi:hypothetical protein
MLLRRWATAGSAVVVPAHGLAAAYRVLPIPSTAFYAVPPLRLQVSAKGSVLEIIEGGTIRSARLFKAVADGRRAAGNGYHRRIQLVYGLSAICAAMAEAHTRA